MFRKKVEEVTAGGDKNFQEWLPVMELTGAWEVAFDPRWGGPDKIVFDKLDDWTKRPEDTIKYFSGAATYRKVIDFQQSKTENPKSRIFLALGEVRDVARVRLNGKDFGVVWCAPWRVDVTEAIKPGANALEIEVINLWPNRLIGDGKLPPEKRLTQTNIDGFYSGEHNLLPSGLLGPVRLMKTE